MAEDVSPIAINETDSLPLEKACFEGVLLATVCYGALVMIYTQLGQVLIRKPKRGRAFWFLIAYSVILSPLATLGIGGMLKFVELAYVNHRTFPGGPSVWYELYRGRETSNIMAQVSTTLLPWFSDLLMVYRLLVLWNNRWWLWAFVMPIYLARVATSVPVLLSELHPTSPIWVKHGLSIFRAYLVLCVALNVFFTGAIAFRIHFLRSKARAVLGDLQASFYTSSITIFVESGAFFTIWTLIFLILKYKDSYLQDIFWKPYFFINAVTRLLIALRMAQDRAWSRDVVNASSSGILDWEVSSTTSITLQNTGASSEYEKRNFGVPKQLRGELATM